MLTSPALALCLFGLLLVHEIEYNLLRQEVGNEMTRKMLLSLKISSDLKTIFKPNEKALFPIRMWAATLPRCSALPVKGGNHTFSLLVQKVNCHSLPIVSRFF